MVGSEHLPARYLARLQRVQRAASTFKIDWALSSPAPWTDPEVAGAGTVHIADSLDELTLTAAQLAMRQIPDDPFLLIGQMTTSDPTRSPSGTESMWAYTHVPQHVHRRCRTRAAHRSMGRTRGGDLRRPDGSPDRGARTRVPFDDRRPIVMGPPDLERARPQPRRWRHQRRYGTTAPAARVPSARGNCSGRDTDPEPLPCIRLGPSGWRRARGVRCERSTRCPAAPSVPDHRPHRRTSSPDEIVVVNEAVAGFNPQRHGGR